MADPAGAAGPELGGEGGPWPPLRAFGGGRGGGALRVGAALIALLIAAALAAPLLTPADPAEQLDPVAGRYLPPGSHRAVVRLAGGGTLLADRVERLDGAVTVERLGRVVTLPAAEVVSPAPGQPAESRLFLLGTDRFGRDLWSRLVYGTRVSLAVGLLTALLALSIGVVVGAAAGIGGPLADGVLMRAVDAMVAMPRMFLVVAVVALFRPGGWAIVGILGATGWMTISRLLRAELLALQKRPFVLAARGLGLSPFQILRRHLLPNALTPVLVQTGLLVGDAILAESTLSFLGLGIPPPAPSWGNLIAEGQSRLIGAWWLATFPGLAIVVTVVAFNLVVDGLRDRLDPRSR
jgi:peptide/nickel transport system permease protein